MTAARSFFDGLWETLTGRGAASDNRELMHADPRQPSPEELRPMVRRYGSELANRPYCILHGYAAGDHSGCVINTGPWCGEPVTQEQIDERDAFPIDERGPDDGKYEHVWCVQSSRCK